MQKCRKTIPEAKTLKITTSKTVTYVLLVANFFQNFINIWGRFKIGNDQLGWVKIYWSLLFTAPVSLINQLGPKNSEKVKNSLIGGDLGVANLSSLLRLNS